jgi:hypothetical protein
MGGVSSMYRKIRNKYKHLLGTNHAEDIGVDGKIILKLILWKYSWNMWSGFIRLRMGNGGGLL